MEKIKLILTRIGMAIMFTVMVVVVLAYSMRSEVDKNNSYFTKNVKKINASEVVLNDITPFAWDTLYTFIPYTSKDEIQKIIGFRSSDIKETVNEGMTQLLFVKGKNVVCSILGYTDSLGYGVFFGSFEGNYLAIESSDHAIFTVEKSDGKNRLHYFTK